MNSTDFRPIDPPVTTNARREALADGTLVDVTYTATDVGFKVPVAVARDVFEDAVYWEADDQLRKRLARPTNAHNRLLTLLQDALIATAVASGQGVEAIDFVLLRIPRKGRGWVPRRLALTAHIVPTDMGTAITIARAATTDRQEAT